MTDAPGAPTRWRSRITRHADVDPSELAAHPLNFRRHPKMQADALSGVLDQVGYVQSVVVNERNGRILDGHLRVELAIARGEPSVPAAFVDVDDDDERLILATFDPLGALADTDGSALRSLLDDLVPTDDALARLVSFLARETDDPVAEWQGMPAFQQDDEMPFRTLYVHFADQSAVDDFAAIVGQAVSEKAKWIWHPKQERVPRLDHQWVSDEP